MYRHVFAAAIAGLMWLAPQTGHAADRALILLQHEVERDWYSSDRFGFNVLVRQLRADGFEVTIEDGPVVASRSAVSTFWSQMTPDDRAVIVAFGRVVSTPRDSWLLMQNASRPDAISIAGQGISLGGLSDVLADAPGRSMLVIGRTGNQQAPRRGLQRGFAPFDVPQGVSLIAGHAQSVFPFVSGRILADDRPVRAALDAAPGLVAGYGFLPDLPFAPAPRAAQQPSGETRFWQAVEAVGSEAAYRAYLDKHPGGSFAALAQERLAALETARTDRARQDEAALGLTRAERRAVQRDLTLLGFDTNGIDGLFGRGTRSAIREWQGSVDLEPDGYLNVKQRRTLRQLAAARQQALEVDDRAYWDRTGADGSESGLQAYLGRYPQGVFADRARRELAAFDAQRTEAAQARERVAWQDARAVGSAEALQAFLQQYPDGVYAAEARKQLAELQAASAPQVDPQQARAEERSVIRTKVVRLLVEQRLLQLGLKPGRVDGDFDDRTRAAITRFQRANGLPVSGFVTRATAARLLSGGK